MDSESQDIDIETLQQMPYAELRKTASKLGIQRMKADKLVKAIMSKVSNTDVNDCFSTPAAKLINSSKKNKEMIFDENQKTPLETPRRGTFTVETPSFVVAGNLLENLEDSASVLDESNVTFSRGSERKLRCRKVSFMSPTLTPRTPRSQSLRNRPKTPVATRMPLDDTSAMDCSLVELKRKSPNKSLLSTPAAKVNKHTRESDVKTENPRENFSTPLPSSVQKSEKRTRLSRADVSFKNVGDVKTENSRESSCTPLPSSVQKSEKRTRFSRAEASLKNIEDVNTENPRENSCTPHPFSVQKSEKRTRLSKAGVSFKNSEDVKTENSEENSCTPLPSSVQISEKKARLSKAGVSFKNVADEKEISTVVNCSTPANGLKVVKSMNTSGSKLPLTNDKNNTNSRSAVKEPTSLKKKQTPNFKRIHQKAFDKMESIDDYQKRKMLNSAKKLAQHNMLKSKVTKAKSKIPAFSGIPFIHSKSNPSAKSTACRIMRIDGSKAPPMSKENIFKNTSQNKSGNKKQNLPKTPLSAKSKSKLGLETSLKRKDTPMSAKSKEKFNLKQSLSRKLNYKPHRGPLKPLTVANTSVHSTSVLQPKEPVENKAVTKNRSQNRSLIRGVRMNKRFELQMKNRKLD